jgi:hypothetical protein
MCWILDINEKREMKVETIETHPRNHPIIERCEDNLVEEIQVK